MTRALAILLVTSSIVGSVSLAYAQHAMMDDKELMTKLKDAAPPRILEHATVMNMGADGKMKVIQQGNNGWTCMDPGGAPMCADKAAMEWAEAWQSKPPAPQKNEVSSTCSTGTTGQATLIRMPPKRPRTITGLRRDHT